MTGGALAHFYHQHAGGRHTSSDATATTCDDLRVSRRDLAHVMSALWDLSGGRAGVPVAVAAVDEAIGRGPRDMRTPLNLASLAEQRVVVAVGDDGWALTEEGVEWLLQDRELSDR